MNDLSIVHLKNEFYEEVKKATESGASGDELKALLGKGRAKKGMFEGDLDQGELEIGQIASLLHEVIPAKDIVAEIINEYNNIGGKKLGGYFDF